MILFCYLHLLSSQYWTDKCFRQILGRMFLYHALESSVYIMCLYRSICIAPTVCCHSVRCGGLLLNNFTCSSPGGFLFTLSFCLCVLPYLSHPVKQPVPLGWGRGEPSGPQETLSISISLSHCPSLMTQASTLVAWMTPSVSSHLLDWELSIKCLGCSVTGRHNDRQSLCLCVWFYVKTKTCLAFLISELSQLEFV